MLVVSVGERRIGAVELRPGMETFSLPVLPDVLTLGNNFLTFAFSRVKPRTPDDPRLLAGAFDFVELSATDDPARPVGEEVQAEGGDIILPRRSTLAFSLSAPPDAVFEFGAESMGPPAEGLVALRTEDGTERVLWTGESASRQRVALAAAAGEQVELVFRALGDGPIRWVAPRLSGAMGAADVTTNVLFIVIDTLRRDHLGVYGGEPHTPHMDALAAAGVRFARAYSPIPSTGPAHSSMFTSLHPRAHGSAQQSRTAGAPTTRPSPRSSGDTTDGPRRSSVSVSSTGRVGSPAASTSTTTTSRSTGG